MFVEKNQQNGKNQVDQFTKGATQSNNDRMDALAITPMCLRIAFAMDNCHGYIPLWEDDPNYIEECQHGMREKMLKCCCSNCDEENSIKLIDNLLAASVSNFDSIVSDNFTVSKSYDLHSKYPKRHTGTRKRKILPDERLEMDKFKLSMIKELHAYYYTIFKQGGSLMPKHLFANEEAEAIVNSFQNITSVQKLQRVIGVEAFAGQREWLFKWIDEYKESREKEMDDESCEESEDVLWCRPSKRIKTMAILGVLLDSAGALDQRSNRFASLRKAPFFRSEAESRFPVGSESESAAPCRFASLSNSGPAASLRCQTAGPPLRFAVKQRARRFASLSNSGPAASLRCQTAGPPLLPTLKRESAAPDPRFRCGKAAAEAAKRGQTAFPAASALLQTQSSPLPLSPPSIMAPANPPDDVPSTPPNHPEEPDVPQSTRRESSRIRTPLSRPGFIPTASDSRRALIGNPTQPRRRPATTPSSDPLPDEPNKGDKEEESSDDVIETQATGQRPGTKKVASKVTQVLKRTGKGIEVDLAQDSDNEHSQLATKKDKTKDSNGFDHWVLYFHPPGQGPNQKPGDEACACRWCPKEVMVSDRSTTT
ncbi:hypothetical protein PSTT_09733 [Puccinia striiformis]|uniref:Uncharacterized protein n=1 Tax=Puccinia striiformis TaxID=27350 RepID=A0A2S4V7A6_9BASI|nr:hypothetical protein PSTT_09733 [Puccinia striiformis]